MKRRTLLERLVKEMIDDMTIADAANYIQSVLSGSPRLTQVMVELEDWPKLPPDIIPGSAKMKDFAGQVLNRVKEYDHTPGLGLYGY